MNYLLNKISIIISMGLIVMLVYSCQKFDSNLSVNNISELKLDYSLLKEILDEEPVELMSDKVNFLKGGYRLLHDSQTISASDKNSEIESVLLQLSVLDHENFNEMVSLADSKISVLAVTLLKDDNDEIDGMILHFLDGKGTMKLEAYKRFKTQDTFERIFFPANQVSTFVLENLLYVTRTLFPKRNIVTLGSSRIAKIVSENNIDDIALLRFASNNNLLQQSNIFRGTSNPLKPEGYKAPDPKPCAIAVHHCKNGSDILINCQPFSGGCKKMPEKCPKEEVYIELLDEEMESELQLYEANLVNDSLYSFKDWLHQQPKGKLYHDAYYNMSSHFSNTLDFELLSVIVTASLDMGNFVNAFLNDDQNYILDEQTFYSFINIIQMSSDKSQSSVYKDIIEDLIDGVQVYKSKNIQQIKALLSE